MSRFIRSLWLLLPLVALAALAPPVAAAEVVFSRPTDAPVLDPFRLPDGPFGAGNRGIEYATAAGDPIHAAAPGTVAFAGAVAGDLFVSVDHPGGLRSTYGFVGNVLVRRGDEVRRGEPVALAAASFHFTVRLDGVYVDPEPLFGRRTVRVRLVPHGPSTSRPVAASSLAPWFDTAGLAPDPATLLDGPNGPRTFPHRDRRNHWVRATPGRLGVPHEHATGKEGRPWLSSP